MKMLNVSASPRLKIVFLVAAAFVLISINISPCIARKSKYSEELNVKNLENEERPFRMKKTNVIWDKARQKLHGKKLAEAYAELELHDKREAELKKLKTDGLDKDGAMEEKVLKSYKRLMDLYSLDDEVKSRRRNDIDQLDDEPTFADEKLQGMWKRAISIGFSGDDLKMLKEEFQHQQMKIDEHNYVHGQFDYEGADNEVIDNKEKKPEDSKKSKQVIRAGYMRLEEMVSALPKTEGEFKDQRVNTMWELAKKTNWTSTELESFREELSHLDHKLLKQAHYAEKVQDSLRKFEDPETMPSKHKHVYDTANLINRRVEKIRGELKTRLDKALRHIEL